MREELPHANLLVGYRRVPIAFHREAKSIEQSSQDFRHGLTCRKGLQVLVMGLTGIVDPFIGLLQLPFEELGVLALGASLPLLAASLHATATVLLTGSIVAA